MRWQIAKEFYKIVVWFDERGKLRATGYVLNQKGYPGAIERERLDFGNVMAKRHVPIVDIERRTGLRFHANIVEKDTTPAQT